MRIKKGDNVQVLSGNDKGKTGEVLEVMPKEDKVVVKGVNIRNTNIKLAAKNENRFNWGLCKNDIKNNILYNAATEIFFNSFDFGASKTEAQYCEKIIPSIT